MTIMYDLESVRYACSCGSLRAMAEIYFCRYCFKIRCGYCLCQQVDSHYCPTCLEGFPVAEVRLRKHRCPACFVCPCCFQTVSTRATHVVVLLEKEQEEKDKEKDKEKEKDGKDKDGKEKDGKDKDGKLATKKVLYLFCSSCRWTSRDAGIPDQLTATGGWPEMDNNPHTNRVNALIDYHKILSSRARQQGERKKFQPRRVFAQISATRQSTTGLTSATLRKLIDCPTSIIQPESQVNSDIPPPAIASEDVEELESDIFTKTLDLMKVTTLDQRLRQPELQAEKSHDLRPQHRQFFIKRAQRCRECEHNVVKPDLSQETAGFMIQCTAYKFVPEVKIVTCEPLKVGKSSELLLKFSNPLTHDTIIDLLPLDTPLSPVKLSVQNEEEPKESDTIVEEKKAINVTPNADLDLPLNSLELQTMHEGSTDANTTRGPSDKDDPKIVVWRQFNEVVIRLHVTPREENDEKQNESSCIIGFIMQYTFRPRDKTTVSQTIDIKLNSKVYLKLEKIAPAGLQ